MTDATPAGWYDDGHGAQRYWDGGAWTQQTLGGAGSAAPRPRRRLWPWLLGLGLLLAAGATAIVLVVVNNSASSPSDRAAAVVLDYDRAWIEGDCEAFQALTTESFRAGWLETCADFESQAEGMASWGYETTIETSAVSDAGAAATVITRETYSYDGEDYDEKYEYSLILVDDAFVIDGLILDE